METQYIRLKVTGERAMFARPEYPTEPVSYACMTPTAAKGILDSILWKPEMRYVIRAITVLRPGTFVSVKKNQVKKKMSPADPYLCVDDTDVRTQRVYNMLADVAYIIDADIHLRPHAQEPAEKYMAMFNRRVRKGQCYRPPVLGTRDCLCAFDLVESYERPCDWTEDLGPMVHSFDYDTRKAHFFHARVDRGVVLVPDSPLQTEEAAS